MITVEDGLLAGTACATAARETGGTAPDKAAPRGPTPTRSDRRASPFRPARCRPRHRSSAEKLKPDRAPPRASTRRHRRIPPRSYRRTRMANAMPAAADRAIRQQPCLQIDPPGDAPQAVRTVPHGVHRRRSRPAAPARCRCWRSPSRAGYVARASAAPAASRAPRRHRATRRQGGPACGAYTRRASRRTRHAARQIPSAHRSAATNRRRYPPPSPPAASTARAPTDPPPRSPARLALSPRRSQRSDRGPRRSFQDIAARSRTAAPPRRSPAHVDQGDAERPGRAWSARRGSADAHRRPPRSRRISFC